MFWPCSKSLLFCRRRVLATESQTSLSRCLEYIATDLLAPNAARSSMRTCSCSAPVQGKINCCLSLALVKMDTCCKLGIQCTHTHTHTHTHNRDCRHPPPAITERKELETQHCWISLPLGKTRQGVRHSHPQWSEGVRRRHHENLKNRANPTRQRS
jgi:hypothetical protein